jgi:hypothetical protein
MDKKEAKKKLTKPDNTEKKRAYQEKAGGKFAKGNPGKPEGTKNYLTILEEALEKQAKEEGISYWDKLARWSFRNPSVAVSILKKYIPDKTSNEITTPEGIEIVIHRAKDES